METLLPRHLRRYLIGADPPSAAEALRSVASRFPNPTNAQAVAAIEAVSPQPVDADDAIAAGWREDIARAFLPPDGIFPRMRLLAWGWKKKGDVFKAPGNEQWWRSRYQYPLWNPLETYLTQADSGGHGALFSWDDQLASGAPALLSYAYPSVVRDDLPPVNEAPCPKWLIPPGRFQMPVPNPECWVRELPKGPAKDIIDRLRPPKKEPANYLWLILILIAAADRR